MYVIITSNSKEHIIAEVFDVEAGDVEKKEVLNTEADTPWSGFLKSVYT
jgi:hypothetical protein